MVLAGNGPVAAANNLSVVNIVTDHAVYKSKGYRYRSGAIGNRYALDRTCRLGIARLNPVWPERLQCGHGRIPGKRCSQGRKAIRRRRERRRSRRTSGPLQLLLIAGKEKQAIFDKRAAKGPAKPVIHEPGNHSRSAARGEGSRRAGRHACGAKAKQRIFLPVLKRAVPIALVKMVRTPMECIGPGFGHVVDHGS